MNPDAVVFFWCWAGFLVVGVCGWLFLLAFLLCWGVFFSLVCTCSELRMLLLFLLGVGGDIVAVCDASTNVGVNITGVCDIACDSSTLVWSYA